MKIISNTLFICTSYVINNLFPPSRKDYIVEELINTEEKYIDILRKIVEVQPTNIV